VLSDISIDWGSVTVSDVYPYPLPDLFAGTQMIVAGRYRPQLGIFGSGGATTITLKGAVNGGQQSFKYSDVSFRSSGGDEFIPRLWATRKIGYLLNEIRLRGESKEIVNEIVTLAVRYGIVTPYTSFLVDERQDVLTQTGRNLAAQEAAKGLAPSAMPTSGAQAVQQSVDQNMLRGAMSAPTAAPMATQAPKAGAPAPSVFGAVPVAPVQAIGNRTFLLRNEVWMDTLFDPSKMTTVKIEFGSEAYFALVANNPELGKYLALGSRIIVVINGAAYEISDSGAGVPSSSYPPALPPATIETRAIQVIDATPAAPTNTTRNVAVQPTSKPMQVPQPEPTGANAGSNRNMLLLMGGGLMGLGLVGTAIVIVLVAIKSR
jgi:Ca-activated chloride channel homolog